MSEYDGEIEGMFYACDGVYLPEFLFDDEDDDYKDDWVDDWADDCDYEWGDDDMLL